MRYGFVLPGGTATEQVALAELADGSGWDGVFVWEGAYGVDAWSLLAAMAMRTTRVTLGTMLTPLPWRRPWKVASQAATLDDLSGGRAVLSVGLGATDAELGTCNEVTDRRTRAELLDEGIDLMTSLWAGDLRFEGRHFQVDLTARAVPAVRRVPIWVVGAWPRPKSMRRVLRCDGLLPMCMGDDGFRTPTPDDVRAMLAWLDDHGGRRPGFDVVMEGETPAGPESAEGAEIVGPWIDAGCTWWLETRWMLADDVARAAVLRERIEAGPPRV